MRLVEGFLEALAAERGASAIRRGLPARPRRLRGFLGERARRAGATPATTCAAFLAARAAEGLKASSLARRLSAIRQFHKHLYAEGRRAGRSDAAIEGPRRGRPLPKVSTSRKSNDSRGAREGLDAPDRPSAERLAAPASTCLVELIYGSGLRVSEDLRFAEVCGAHAARR